MTEALLVLVILLAGVAVWAVVRAMSLERRLKVGEAQFAGLQQQVVGMQQFAAGLQQQLAHYQQEFGGAISKMDRERALTANIQALEANIGVLEAQRQAAAQNNAAAEQTFRANFAASQNELNVRIATLRRTVEALEEQSDLQSAGFYRAQYNFATAAEYEARLETVRDRQKAMIKAGTAAMCARKWSVDGDQKEGERMTREFIKLVLRAFNGECDATVMRVKYNNVTNLVARIKADYESINKLSARQTVSITQEFLELKLNELFLVHEYQEKKQAEAEEQRQIREQMREEERALKEIERAREDAEKDERRYEAALQKAQAEVAGAVGKQKDALEQKIRDLSEKLAAAEAVKQKAISQAQLTTAGHVYVISNVGSFGEHVYKIGMTRRLTPQERVDELGDASVPFAFDVHAMIYTENAPDLERRLHQLFQTRQVNKVNVRKEFFRVALDEIEGAVREIVLSLPKHAQREVRFVKTAAAEEYRKSLALEAEWVAAEGRRPVVLVAGGASTAN